MKLRHLVTVNSALLIATGILFWLGPENLLLEGFGVPPGHVGESGTGAAYAPHALGRLLGAVGLGFGLLLLAVRDVGDSALGRRITGALCAADAVAFPAALTQQIAIWESAPGWVTAGAFLLLALGYGARLVPRRRDVARRRPVAQGF